MNACADDRGVFAALAVDHRGNLLQALAEARGPGGQANAADMLAFKTAVTQVLTPYASAILLDPEYGLGAIPSRAPRTGVMLAYEQSGYYVSDRLSGGRTQSVAGRNKITHDIETEGRLPDLLPEQSVRRLVEAGAQAIKILLYYNPYDAPRINSIKQAYVERIGAECAALEAPFFLEALVYDGALGDEKGPLFARRKPDYALRAIEEFRRPRYGVDVLKVEMPVNPAFVSGTRAYNGAEAAYSRNEAAKILRETASAASLPLIYLSAGVSNDVFCEMLEIAAEAGARFSGVLCGRATWQEGIAIYGQQGDAALRSWLADRGAQNIQAVNDILAGAATPWWDVYGGLEKSEITI
ncbi:MAG TPA: tagatose 1,6-diphosphate aldolase [Chthonomonadales bacterium]|nr:tagatose 1,6-diphosphate aldolase [Chthonomonadales bacterium]